MTKKNGKGAVAAGNGGEMVSNGLPFGIERVLVSSQEIAKRIKELASVINNDYKDSKKPLIIVGVLKGSFIFLADLVREITVPHIVDFISVTSYGNSKETKSTGTVRLLMDTREDQKDHDVLIVEDILDSGWTLAYLNKYFLSREPKSVRNIVLLDKPNRHEADVSIDYLGFKIDDVWVVGYGLDYREKFRTLGYIAELDVSKVKEEE